MGRCDSCHKLLQSSMRCENLTVCHLMENCDDRGGGEYRLGEVLQLSGSVTVIREV